MWAANRPIQRVSQTLPTFEASPQTLPLFLRCSALCGSLNCFPHSSHAKKKKNCSLDSCSEALRVQFFCTSKVFFFCLCRLEDQMSPWNSLSHADWQSTWKGAVKAIYSHAISQQQKKKWIFCSQYLWWWRWKNISTKQRLWISANGEAWSLCEEPTQAVCMYCPNIF